MKRLVGLVAFALPIWTLATVQAAERTMVVPADATPFKVTEKDTVRLTGKGIAGAKITAKVEGPAKIEAENTVFQRVKGQTLIGTTVKEFEVKPTGKGKVKVAITVTPPQPDAKPMTTDYEFQVE